MRNPDCSPYYIAIIGACGFMMMINLWKNGGGR
jgi:hypothetical protein